ncbi:hypothetical protein SAMN05880582_11435 [Rhizobium sp. RU20A]|nr:hypothetical protein SAMN05880582_11435 [Rhizobium sp. RU20A]
MNMPQHHLNVQYDAASRTALLQCGARSKVLRGIATPDEAQQLAYRFAERNWGYAQRSAERNAEAREMTQAIGGN